jgi:UDP-N-acetylmuramoyl-tripeptide--D-alanyl-D-alanine ligase
MRARVTTAAGERLIEIPLLGSGNLSNVLAAMATAIEMGVRFDDVADRTRALEPAPRRGAVRHLRDGIVLIDDSYNSSPAALRRALEVVAAEAGARRKVVVLGEMLELGAHAAALHEACGRAAVEAGVTVLYAVGGASARRLADAARAAGLPAEAVYVFEDSENAVPEVVARTAPGDLILVKGSRGVRTDIVADRLSAELA